MYKSKGTQFNCFSPPVMVATLAIEIALAAYALWRYKLTQITKIIIVFLLALATFQFAEYQVCSGFHTNPKGWSTLGFVAISTLPPMGIHIMHLLANKPKRVLIKTAYASMAGFIIFFLLSPSVFTGHQCTGNYAIFQFSTNVTGIYSIYYFGWILAGISLGILWANQLKAEGKSAFTQLETVKALTVGYLVFLVPTFIVNVIKPETRQGIPSVLCGFAILLALILALYILPRVAERRHTS